MKGMLLRALALTVLAALPAAAQASAYPNVDRVVALADGDSIRVIIRLVNEGPFSRPPGRRLDYVYFSRIPASNAEGRKAQADRAAEFFGPEAVEIGARRLSIGICDTEACARRQHPPSVWYLYERTSRGWRRIPG